MPNLENIKNLERIKASDFRSKMKEVINRVTYAKERFVIKRSKEEVGIIPIELLDFLEKVIEKLEDKIDILEIEKILSSKSKPIPYEEARKRLGLF